ncbi:MAG: hypothetical protein OEN01_03990 [Candidatus Krumholzibacteria bacterium]|nr:hypothetical protein [Candidatus Krumholzibacteria bacterium]
MKFVRIVLCVALLLTPYAFVGCGEDNGPVAPSPLPTELVASWTYESVTFGGTEVPLHIALDWRPATVTATMTLAADNRYLYEEWDVAGGLTWTETGTVSVSGPNFWIRVTRENGVPVAPDVTSGMWSLNGNEMIATIQEGADTIVTVFTKP